MFSYLCGAADLTALPHHICVEDLTRVKCVTSAQMRTIVSTYHQADPRADKLNSAGPEIPGVKHAVSGSL